jgi:hypothetical protein
MTIDDRDLATLEARLRQWGRRPPATSARAAARQVVQRLDGVATPRRWTRRLALATAASVIGLVAWLALVPPAPVRPPSAPGDPLPPLPENVVLFWLDPETPVYFVTGPVRTVARGSP